MRAENLPGTDSDVEASSVPVKIAGIAPDDPWDPRTWSGITSSFFGALHKQGALAGAVAAKPKAIVEAAYKLKNLAYDRQKRWFKHSLDVDLFHARTAAGARALAQMQADYDTTIQIGAWYDFSSPGVVNASYHDGNLARTLDNPYGAPKIAPGRIARAMEYEKQLYGKMDAILTMSRWLANSFVRDFGVPEHKVHAIYGGPNMTDVDEETPHNDLESNILFVGIDFRRKGGFQLLEAFRTVRREVPKATLTIVGPRLLHGLPEGVQWAGFADKRSPSGRTKLDQLYRQASVLVLPSLYEPFGVALVEGMAYSLPCVASNAWAMPEIVQHEVTGLLCEPGDTQGLAECLIEILRDPQLRRHMGQAGFDRYRERFRWSAVAKRATEMLTRVASSS